MTFPFSKYHGTGNDFILIDNRNKKFPSKNVKWIASLCDRRFGIGADGLILLENSKGHDFEMKYFNSDGREGSLCGNGGRCISAFALKLGIVRNDATFTAFDGKHISKIISHHTETWSTKVKLKLNDVSEIEKGKNYFFLDTGSPHYVVPVNELESLDVFSEGKKIRYGKRFAKTGTNVDFIKKNKSGIEMRVYERGVEDETFSSGTGAVASAIAAFEAGWLTSEGKCVVSTKGGTLNIYFEKNQNRFENIWLEGDATFVYEGVITV